MTIEIYDSTLRDGSQREGLSLSIEDKLRIAERLDALGVHYIEGGWPGANPKDTEFFQRAGKELALGSAKLVAFGATRKAATKAVDDIGLAALVDSETEVVCIVAKAWDYHVTEALRTTLDEAVEMVRDSVSFLRLRNRRVFVDAEHFFDGYKNNPEFALDIVRAASESGAETVILCDTNGGTLPSDVGTTVEAVRSAIPNQRLGGHFHNDSGCGVGNALSAVQAGVQQVQGCVNGYGERTGNTNLITLIPTLALKLGIETIPTERLPMLTGVAHHVAELVNVSMNPQQPYVGMSAFAHKAGIHTSAISRRPDAYEHVGPEQVGNKARFVVSELAGRSTVQLKAKELGITLTDTAITQIIDDLKRLEREGYHYEVADASQELLFRRATGWKSQYFELESYRVISDSNGSTEATVKLRVGNDRVVATGEGNGPVHALDQALRQAIEPQFPVLSAVHLTDFRVRVLDTSKATGAVTRVLIDTSNGERTWTTIGVSENIIDASWNALVDSITYALLKSS